MDAFCRVTFCWQMPKMRRSATFPQHIELSQFSFDGKGVLGDVQEMSGQCTVETLFDLAAWLFLSCCQSQLSGLLVQKEKVVCVCWGEGVDTGKSYTWSVFTFSPPCPIVQFGIWYVGVLPSRCSIIKEKRLSASSKLKTSDFLYDLSFHLDLLYTGHVLCLWTFAIQYILSPCLYLLPLPQSVGMPSIHS